MSPLRNVFYNTKGSDENQITDRDDQHLCTEELT